NTDNGVRLTGAGTTGNLVEGNRVGTDAAGASALGNGAAGVWIEAAASGNTVGGTAAGSLNVISGNRDVGVGISHAAANVVENNYIGTAQSGSQALGNGSDGVLVVGGASNNTIGSITAGLGNLVSGNAANGVRISGWGTNANLVEGNFIGTDIH